MADKLVHRDGACEIWEHWDGKEVVTIVFLLVTPAGSFICQTRESAERELEKFRQIGKKGGG